MLKKFGKSTSVKFYSELFKQSRNALKNGKANNPLEVFVESESQSGFASRIKVRDFEFTIDQPHSFGGTNKGPKPSELLLASLAACQEVTWRLYAAANDIPLTSIRVELKGIQDLRGFLSIDDQKLIAPRREASIKTSAGPRSPLPFKDYYKLISPPALK